MSHHAHFGPKPDPREEQSPKAHVDNPPKGDTGESELPAHPRGDFGQFTDYGSPGNQKK